MATTDPSIGYASEPQLAPLVLVLGGARTSVFVAKATSKQVQCSTRGQLAAAGGGLGQLLR